MLLVYCRLPKSVKTLPLVAHGTYSSKEYKFAFGDDPFTVIATLHNINYLQEMIYIVAKHYNDPIEVSFMYDLDADSDTIVSSGSGDSIWTSSSFGSESGQSPLPQSTQTKKTSKKSTALDRPTKGPGEMWLESYIDGDYDGDTDKDPDNIPPAVQQYCDEQKGSKPIPTLYRGLSFQNFRTMKKWISHEVKDYNKHTKVIHLRTSFITSWSTELQVALDFAHRHVNHPGSLNLVLALTPVDEKNIFCDLTNMNKHESEVILKAGAYRCTIISGIIPNIFFE